MTVSRQDSRPKRSGGGPGEDGGPQDRGPRARTRRLILETAIELMQHGTVPSVSELAEAAEVSRATAYRYFPDQARLVDAVVGEALGPILDWERTSDDAETAVTDLLEFSLPRIGQFEATFRAALKLSLEQWARRQEGAAADADAPVRRGHRIPRLAYALAPLAEELSPERFARLHHALAVLFGIESYITLRDICRMDHDAAQRLVVWSARALIEATVAEEHAEARDAAQQENPIESR